ncbi:substrate-binding periplasmic protein [Undibacterium sp. TJN25]|uniref:substrate-binding periplasmic protein n=1 Tax=Undibacterium sp. TJN25 TaxID=3413056 RepID=UPI003BF2EA5E
MSHRFKILLCLVALSSALPAHARELLAVGTEFASVYERSVAGEYSGLGVEIVKAIARQNGDTVRFGLYPWARAQLMVEEDQADILIGPYKTREREARFSFAARAFYRDYMVFYVRNGQKNGWDGNYQGLRGRKIGVINGWAYGPKFENIRGLLQPEVANSLPNALTMLSAGRIDYLAANLRNTEALLKAGDLGSEFTVLHQTLDVQDGYLAFCKKSTCDLLRRQFDQGFERLRASGEFGRMAHSHGIMTP